MSAEERGKMRGTGNNSTEPGEADATLRLIAELPAPDGLSERVKGRLQAKSVEAARGGGRLLEWPTRASAGHGQLQNWMRSAAAAAIVGVVSGGAWWIYASVAPAGGGSAVAAPVSVHRAGGFTTAGAMRTPETLKGPVLTHEVEKKAEPAKKDVQAGKKSTKPASQSK
jgi:hypothetical protein